MVESDCLELVQVVNSEKTYVVWDCYVILEDIFSRMGAIDNFSISSIGRKENGAADWLAKISVREMCPWGWVMSLPSPLAGILRGDGSDITHGFLYTKK